jgi:aspartokinase-like uncharacterized kinase
MTSVRAKQPMLRVVKVGGSLFVLPDLASRIKNWLKRQPPAINILLAGGGELADVIRRADERHRLGESAAHWLCIEAMGVTSNWLATIGAWPLFDTCEGVTQVRSEQPAPMEAAAGVLVFDPRAFLKGPEPTVDGPRLPHSWEVTSDSIAARFAVSLRADELVLLKSVPPPSFGPITELAESGYVDAFFPKAAETLASVRIVDLSSQLAEHGESERSVEPSGF